MKKIQFNLNERPKLESENVAYVVNSENFNIMRQYVENYYKSKPPHGESWADWFDELIGDEIRQNPEQDYSIYFGYTLFWDSVDYAYKHGYDLYYIIPPMKVMTIE